MVEIKFKRLKQRAENNYCSQKCFYKHKIKTMSGNKNHQFGLKGELNSSFKSDMTINNGYILVRNNTHPLCHEDGFMFLHRLIYEEYLNDSNSLSDFLIDIEGYQKKVLSPEIIVHHKHNNTFDNRISNLEGKSISEHTTLHNLQKKFIRNDKGQFVKQIGKIKNKNTLYKKHDTDAGQDIFSNEDCIIEPNNRKLVSTNLYIELPKNHVGLIWSRSGLSVKHGIEVGAGCIDYGYTGEVKVVLYNHSQKSFNIKKGDRIAQLLTIPINLNRYETIKELTESNRGKDGFGSSDNE